MIVLLALQEKVVAITDAFNPKPITGRNAIFAKVNAPTETKLDVEIIGVYSQMETAMLAREGHAKAHPGRRYLQKVCQLDGNMPQPPQPNRCIMCGVEIGPRGSYCPPCQTEHYRLCNAMDPRGGEGDLVPSPKTSFGAQSTLRFGQN